MGGTRAGPLAVLIFCLATPLGARRFYHDDPLAREPKAVSVREVKPRKLSDYYDFVSHTLDRPGERQPKSGAPIAAKAVNTLGEPMDGAWYTRRQYYAPMSTEQMLRGPGGNLPPSTSGPWTVIAAKNEGITPGFVMLDSAQRRYFVKFDPLSNPEMATGADQVSTKFFHALGYHVADNYIVYFSEAQLLLGENVEIAAKAGKKRRMTRRDLLEILLKAPKRRDGKYRATASLQVEGSPIGPFRYFGTRSDDPNDVVPHEHRRELRGLGVFCAWLDHDDSRSVNTLDSVVEEDGVRYIRHYLADFGSTLGSASSRANSPRSGGEYLFAWHRVLARFFSLGLNVPYWAYAKYPDLPSVGHFESKVFDPERWVPEYPNPAFENRLPDDEFWAAKQVMAFTDEQVRAIVRSGEYSDPAAEKYLADCLMERRNKIGKAYFGKVLPLDRFEVRNASLVWEDLASKHGLGGAGAIRIRWSRFDNDTESRSPLEAESSARLPAEVSAASAGHWVADLAAESNPKRTVRVFLRKESGSVLIVGIDRTW